MKAILNLLFYPVVFIITTFVMLYKELAPEEGLSLKDATKHAREIKDVVADIKCEIDSSSEPTPCNQTETPQRESA